MSQHQTTIRNYTVDLDTDMEGDGKVTGCWIEYEHFTSSLECLLETGVLASNQDDDYHVVAADTIEKIEAWALSNGY